MVEVKCGEVEGDKGSTRGACTDTCRDDKLLSLGTQHTNKCNHYSSRLWTAFSVGAQSMALVMPLCIRVACVAFGCVAKVHVLGSNFNL